MENRIKELRKKNHMSQIRLSIELEVSQETVSAYEKGKYFPSFQTLLKLSNIFHATIDYIMGITDVEKPLEIATNDEIKIIELFRSLNNKSKELSIAYLQGLYDSSKIE